jgi:hypothetical protein
MAEVIFYEKAGCAGNARQKALLRASGHQLVVRDLRGYSGNQACAPRPWPSSARRRRGTLDQYFDPDLRSRHHPAYITAQLRLSCAAVTAWR